jgi:hypothetical protein
MGKSGKFESVVLPLDVQQSPVFTINVLDFNADGKKDLLLCGNMVQSKLRVGRMDANYGLLLQGNGKLGFSAVPQKRTGLWLKGGCSRCAFRWNIVVVWDKPSGNSIL